MAEGTIQVKLCTPERPNVRLDVTEITCPGAQGVFTVLPGHTPLLSTLGAGVVIADTAGRLHTRTQLMDELKKLRRIATREISGAPHEVFLVLDATLGQNSLAQARAFLEVAGVTGIILAKLDGTAKGGMAVAVADELELPIRYAGTGEGLEDLEDFSPEDFARSLLPD